MKAALKSPSPAKSPEEEEIDRLLGDLALFDVADAKKFGGPSVPVIFRAARRHARSGRCRRPHQDQSRYDEEAFA
jgi:hypothetical protein